MNRAQAVLTPPAAGSGVLIGEGDWRLVVQAWLPTSSPARYGTARYGVDRYQRDVWTDLTQFVNSLSTFRGASSFGGSPDVGTANIELKSKNHQFAPWIGPSGSHLGHGDRFEAGLLMRVAVHRPGAWRPVFTGVVEDWVGKFGPDAVQPIAAITLTDTLGSVAGREYQLPASPFGAVATVDGQFRDFMSDAGWLFGVVLHNTDVAAFLLNPPTNPSLKIGSTLEMSRALARGSDLQFFADEHGRAIAHLAVPYTSGAVDEAPPRTKLALSDADLEYGIEIASDADAVVNYGSYTAADGRIFQVDHGPSIRRFGYRPADVDFVGLGRSSGNTTVQSKVDQIQRLIDRRAYLVDRIDEVTLTGRRFDMRRNVEIDSAFEINATPKGSPRRVKATGFVRSISHDIIPLHANAVHWATTFGLDTYNLTTTVAPVPPPPAALKPSTPTGLSADGGDARVTLTWNAVSGAFGYGVYRDGKLRKNVLETTFVDGYVINGDTYTHQVTAYNNVGESAKSTGVSATPKAAPVEVGGSFFDDFNRTDQTFYHVDWTVDDGTWVVQGNRLAQTDDFGDRRLRYIGEIFDNQSISVNVIHGINYGRDLMVRAGPLSDGYRINVNDPTIPIELSRDGSYATNFGVTWTDGDLIELAVSGGTVTLKINGTTRGTYTDPGPLTGGSPAMSVRPDTADLFYDNLTVVGLDETAGTTWTFLTTSSGDQLATSSGDNLTVSG